MTDNGQAQNPLHANSRKSSNCAGQKGHGVGGDRGPDLPRFHRV